MDPTLAQLLCVCGAVDHNVPEEAHCPECWSHRHKDHERFLRDERIRERAQALALAANLVSAPVLDEPVAVASGAGKGTDMRRAKRVADVAHALDAGADWIDQYKSPLGKRKHLSLCREGVLPFRKDGKQRLVRRRDLDAHIQRHPVPSGKKTDVNEIDRELAALGLGEP